MNLPVQEGMLVPGVFRRCVFVRGGALGAIPLPALPMNGYDPRQRWLRFQVAFEPTEGATLLSDVAEYSDQDVPVDVLAFEARTGNEDSLFVAAKSPSGLLPMRLGAARFASQEPDFLAPLGTAPGKHRLLYLEAVPSAYRLGFRLPDLVWQQPVAYGGQTEETLHGLEAFVFLDRTTFGLAEKQSFREAVDFACGSQPRIAHAGPSELWSAAQCERLSGTATETLLRDLTRRCEVLAGLALPLVKRFFRDTESARHTVRPDGGDWEYQDHERREELKRVAPPSACIADDYRLWDVAYTARSGPAVLPAVQLDPAWEKGLTGLAHH